MVRLLYYATFRAPWALVKKGPKGWRKIGPVLQEKVTWPSRNREFPELNPKWYGTNPKQLHSKFNSFTSLYYPLRLYARQAYWLYRSGNREICYR